MLRSVTEEAPALVGPGPTVSQTWSTAGPGSAAGRPGVATALKGHKVLFGSDTEGGDVIHGRKREFRCIMVVVFVGYKSYYHVLLLPYMVVVFVGFMVALFIDFRVEDRCNNAMTTRKTSQALVKLLGSSVGEPTEFKFAKTIQQKLGNGHMWDANGKVDMITGILCY
jgi:hypothetical protein